MKRSTRRLLVLLASLPLVLLAIALLYMLAMSHIEGNARDLWTSLEWAAETLTTTGYGVDVHWDHPLVVIFVIVVQFLGLFLVFLVFPIYVIPFFEERFEARLPDTLPGPRSAPYVLIYRHGPAVATLIEELGRHGRDVVVIEEDPAAARRLHDRGMQVVHTTLGEEPLDFDNIHRALAMVLNGADHENAALVLIAREQGYGGPIYALMDDPLHRDPVIRAGATAAYTPKHVLAAALAAKASDRISPRVSGSQHLGEHVGVAELRIHADSELAGRSLAEARLRERFGTEVVGQWQEGQFVPMPSATAPLSAGTIVMTIGSLAGLERLGQVAKPLKRSGPVVIAGYGDVGQKVDQLLGDAGEQSTVVDIVAGEGVDVVGNALDREILAQAQVRDASAVVLALSSDSEGLFAAAMVRDYAPEVPIIARANRALTVDRLYRAGTADFAMSIGQVAGQLLAHQLLGEEYVSLERSVNVLKIDGAGFRGRHPFAAGIRERTGCHVVAVARGTKVIVDFPEDFTIEPDDAVYICGAPEALDSYIGPSSSSAETSHQLDEAQPGYKF
jgi:voltage-gated potassium channel